MTPSLFVINKYHHVIYINYSTLNEIPSNFTLDDENEVFSLKDIYVELPTLDIFGPLLVLGFLGMLVSSPFGGILGALLGILISMYVYKKSKEESEKVRKGLEKRIVEGT